MPRAPGRKRVVAAAADRQMCQMLGRLGLAASDRCGKIANIAACAPALHGYSAPLPCR